MIFFAFINHPKLKGGTLVSTPLYNVKYYVCSNWLKLYFQQFNKKNKIIQRLKSTQSAKDWGNNPEAKSRAKIVEIFNSALDAQI